MSYSTWMLTVPQLAGYLISHCPRDEWRIQVMSGAIEVRRFEFEIHPSPTKVKPRLSRYERTPVI